MFKTQLQRTNRSWCLPHKRQVASFYRSNIPAPQNEPIKSYLAGSPERQQIQEAIKKMRGEILDIPLVIGGKEVRTGRTIPTVIPHEHGHTLAHVHQAGPEEVENAIAASLKAHAEWSNVSWDNRMGVFLKMAELLAGPYRQVLNAATVLGQSKNWYQAEIDSACELIDFIRFNTRYVQDIISNQPISAPGVWNRAQYRPLEGFVFAAAPFNFTAIAGNLVISPILMGNVAIFKPSQHATLSGHYLMQLYKDAGVPDGVVNFLPGDPAVITDRVLNDVNLAGVHYTGSTSVFQSIWEKTGQNLSKYRSFPRIVGETGGKDFIFAHPSANVPALVTGLVRGAFEYAGQKCSAASRAYIPRSIWSAVELELSRQMSHVKMGNPEDPTILVNAVIHEQSANRCTAYINYARESGECKILYGGKVDKSVGWFVEPTVILTTNPLNKLMLEEIFAPILTIYLYDDDQIDETLRLVDTSSSYALTGAIFAQDRKAIDDLEQRLCHSAGNFYINDKPTGAVVGQQPFGGGRSSGTNDKAGSYLNLTRWTSVRAIKETFHPPTNVLYPYMQQ